MKRRQVVSFLLTVMMLVNGIRFPIAKAEETYRTTGTLIETGRDNGYSGSNKVEKGNPHYGWSLGNFTISGFVRKKAGAFGITTFYVHEGDTGFKLSYKLNYSLDKLAGKDNLSINEDTNGYDTEFDIEKQNFGYGALFLRRRDNNTGKYDKASKRLNFLYARKPGNSFVVTNSMTEGDYELALDYEIQEKYGFLNSLTNWWNYKVTYRFAVRYIDEEPIETSNANARLIKNSSTDEAYRLITKSDWFQNAKSAGTDVGDDGSLIEYYTNGDGTTVTLIALYHDGSLKCPFVDVNTKLQDYMNTLELKQYSVSSEDENSVRFKYISEEQQLNGRAKAYWTEHFVVIALAENANDSFYDQWMDSLVIEEAPIAADANSTVNGARSHVWEIWTNNAMTIQKMFSEEDIIAIAEPWKHGFAAEHATMLIGKIRGIFTGERIEYTGADNAVNGPDFTISKGDTVTLIQAKYYNTAKNSVEACFDGQGDFRYVDSNGNPMRIEVPKDQYNEAVRLMRDKIQQGKIPGVTDPKEADDIVRQGTVTYKQAVNIAKAGTVESITYDAAHGCVAATSAFGVSALVEFAINCWNGEPLDVALNRSIFTGLKVGGGAFIVSVVSSQLSKSALSQAMIPTSKAIVNALGTKAAAVFVNAFRPAGAAIYGAAAKQAAQKLLRGNTITAVISLVVFTVPDIVDAFRGRISVKQLLKNTATTAGGIAGGAGGAWAGAAAGTAIFPGVGTVIGGIIGGLAGGIGGSAGVDAIADLIAEDDAYEMMDIVASVYSTVAEEYLLSADEGERVSVLLQRKIDGYFLKEMYASKNRQKVARDLIEPMIAEEAANREVIMLPNIDTYSDAMVAVLETIEDEAN